MRTGTPSSYASPATPRSVGPTMRSAVLSRFADYAELTRPRIALMALLTVTVGYTIAASTSWRLEPLLHAFFGVGLVAAASSALNQWAERDTDLQMSRTSERPLPAKRISPGEVLLFGILAGVSGCAYLFLTVNGLTAVLALATLLLYVGLYTPLKRHSGVCTIVGAVAGALPPVLGWTAAGGTLDSGAFALFSILFLWQFPHFLAIGWLYRDDYRQAGLRMLPVSHAEPRVTGVIAVIYALALVPVSLLPSELAIAESFAGDGYTRAALLLGVGYVVYAVRFSLKESAGSARDLLWASLIYLPVLLAALTWDHFQLLR